MADIKPIKPIAPGGLAQILQSIVLSGNNISEYDPTKAYRPNDRTYVVDSNKKLVVYKCIDNTTGPFNSNKWSRNTIDVQELLWDSIRNTPNSVDGYGILDAVRKADLIDIDTRGTGYKTQAEGITTAIANFSHTEGVLNQTLLLSSYSDDIAFKITPSTAVSSTGLSNATEAGVVGSKSCTFNLVDCPLAVLLLPNLSLNPVVSLMFLNGRTNPTSTPVNATVSLQGSTIKISFTEAIPSFSRISGFTILGKNSTKATASHAGGVANTVSGIASHVTGTKNTVIGNNSSVSGENNSVSANASIVTGGANTVSGDNSVVAGNSNTVTIRAVNSSVVGGSNYIDGPYATVSGTSNSVGSNASAARINGVGNTVAANISQADGTGILVYADTSQGVGKDNVIGYGATSSHVVGEFNNIGYYETILSVNGLDITLDNASHQFVVGATIKTPTISSISAGSKITAINGATITVNTTVSIGTAGDKIVLVSSPSGTMANGRYGHAEGYLNILSGQYGHVEGNRNIVSGLSAHAQGQNTVASGWTAHAQGNNTIASGTASHTQGNNTIASGTAAHAQGISTRALGTASSARGSNSHAMLGGASTDGTLNIAMSYNASARGYNTIAGAGVLSRSIQQVNPGQKTLLLDYTTGFTTGSIVLIRTSQNVFYNDTIGAIDGSTITLSTLTPNFDMETGTIYTTTSTSLGSPAFAEGTGTKALGAASHAEGSNTLASGQAAHAQNSQTQATGRSSHAQGEWTLASGMYSHAQGTGTIASGDASNASGDTTIAAGPNSQASGSGTAAFVNSGHAEGAGGVVAAPGGIYVVTGLSGTSAVLDTVSGLSVGMTVYVVLSTGSAIISRTINQISGKVVTFNSNAVSSWKYIVVSTVKSGSTFNEGVGAHSQGLGTAAAGAGAHARGVNNAAIAPGASASGQGNVTRSLNSDVTGTTNTVGYYGYDTRVSGRYNFVEGAEASVVGTANIIGGGPTNNGSIAGLWNVVDTANNIVAGASNLVTDQTTGARIISFDSTSIQVDSTFSVSVGQNLRIGYSDNSNNQLNMNVVVTAVTTSGSTKTITVGATVGFPFIVYNVSRGVSGARDGNSVVVGNDNVVQNTNASVVSAIRSKVIVTGSGVLGTGHQVVPASGNEPIKNSLMVGSYGLLREDGAIALGNGTADNALGLAFIARSNGTVSADGAYSSAGADYAEFHEWADQNPDKEDRVGYFVTYDQGALIRKATSDDDFILGIVSATPSIIGDSHNLKWKDKYLTDEWGRTLYEEVIVPEETREHEIIDPDTGEITIETVVVQPEHIVKQPVINPEWNSEQEYTNREQRAEFSAIGLMGKLRVRDDGTSEVNGYVRSNDDGIATKSDTGYRVLERISKNIILVMIGGMQYGNSNR